MTMISAAVDIAFTDDNISQDATWVPLATGEPISVRIVFRSPQSNVGVGMTEYNITGNLIDVRSSDVLSPAEGDQITFVDPVTLLDRSVTVHALNKIDSLGYVQTVEVA